MIIIEKLSGIVLCPIGSFGLFCPSDLGFKVVQRSIELDCYPGMHIEYVGRDVSGHNICYVAAEYEHTNGEVGIFPARARTAGKCFIRKQPLVQSIVVSDVCGLPSRECHSMTC